MYRNQHKDITRIQSGEIANCCDNILDVADSLVTSERFEEQYLVFPVFLAGVSSLRSNDKLRAAEIIRRIEDAGTSVNSERACEMLETIHKEQVDRSWARARGGMARIDWISFARERNIELANFGL